MSKDLQSNKPGRHPQSFDSELDRFLNHVFTSESLLNARNSSFRGSAPQVHETDSSYVLCLDLPGIPIENIDVSVSGNVLMVRGESEKSNDPRPSDRAFERHYRSFQQSFTLPSHVDGAKVEANCVHGVLEIMIPKARLPEGRKINVGSSKTGFLSRFREKAANAFGFNDDHH